MSLLVVEGLCAGYGGDYTVQDLDLEIGENEAVCLLGRNGVGKTTTLRALMGLIQRGAGRVVFDGTEVRNTRPHSIARMGIGYVPQGRELFGKLTVRDNLRLGAVARAGRLEEPDAELLGYFPVLAERIGQRAGTLSGGEQQMAAVARALMARPRILLCDEPSEGLAPSVVDDLGRLLRQAAEGLGVAVLLVEQNIGLARAVATRGYVMDAGRIAASGSIDEITHGAVLSRHVAFSRLAQEQMEGPA